jgi:hypothetical protein
MIKSISEYFDLENLVKFLKVLLNDIENHVIKSYKHSIPKVKSKGRVESERLRKAIL